MAHSVVLVDQDGPLADYRAAILAALESIGENPSHLQKKTYSTRADVQAAYGNRVADEIDRIRNMSGFYEHLEVVEGANEGIKRLLDLGAVPFVCSRPRLQNRTCSSEKLAWLGTHFPEFEGRFVLTTDKTVVSGHILIDDDYSVTGITTPNWKHVYFGNPAEFTGTFVAAIQSWNEVSRITGLFELL